MSGALRSPLAFLIAVTGLGAVAAPGARAQAQRFRPAVAGIASTLGLGAEFSLEARTVALRGGYYLFSTGFDRTIEGITYSVDPELRNGRVVLDVHPFASAFRLSTGVILARSRANGRAVLAGPTQIGSRVYQPSEVGAVLGRGSYDRDLMPYLGLGLATRGTVGFVFDAGVAFSGRPNVRLDAETSLTGAEREEFEQSVREEEAEINQAIADRSLLRYYPVVALGLKLRF